MQSHLVIFFAILISSGLISAHPNINGLQSRTDIINQPNQELYRKRSQSTTSSPRQRKRSLFKIKRRARESQQPGVSCDGRIYKQERVDAVAERACNNAIKSNKGSVRGTLTNLFKTSPKPYNGPDNLFPKLRGLTMRPMSRGLISASQVRRIVGGGKNDFMVFVGQCTPVGIVRQLKGKTSLCASFTNIGPSSVNGNNAASPFVPTSPGGIGSVIVPTRPDGADPAPGSVVAPTRPGGIGSVIVPTRPDGAGPAPGSVVAPIRPDGADQLPKLNGAYLG